MRCKHCKSKFEVTRFLQKYCLSTEDCIKAWRDDPKYGLSKQKQVKQKADDKVTRDKMKTLTELENEAKKSFQKWVRLRDADKDCPSCGTNISVPCWDGGHYKKAELYSGVIFDERNCHKQCRKCNYFLGGNELNYRHGLVERYGLEFITSLESDANRLKEYRYTRDELKALKRKYDDKIKNKDFEVSFELAPKISKKAG